jgi:ABC-2 type transport system ATP-binding protein
MTSPLPTKLIASGFAVTTRSLTKFYGWHRALDNVALQVPEGATYLLVGANGAGKSTTIKILLDLVRQTTGSAEVFGLDTLRQSTLIRANIGYVPEQLHWGYGWMSVRRLLEHHSAYFPTWDATYAAHLARAFEVRLDWTMKDLSKGQGRSVHLLMALAHRPPLLLLDEPTDGLDPVMRDRTLALLIEHVTETPTTMLVSTHHVSEMEQFADHIGVLRNGELVAQMPLAALQRDLRRYRAEVPADWGGDSLFGDAVLRRATTANQMDWTVWGDETHISRELAGAGAMVRDSRPLSLNEAALALLTPRGKAQ